MGRIQRENELAERAVTGDMSHHDAVRAAMDEGISDTRVAWLISDRSDVDVDARELRDEVNATARPTREQLDRAFKEAQAFCEENVPKIGTMPTSLFTRRLKDLSPLARKLAARSLSRSLANLPRKSKNRASFEDRVKKYKSQKNTSNQNDMSRDSKTSYLNYSLMKGSLRRAAKRGGRPIPMGRDPAEAAGLEVFEIDGRQLVREDDFYQAKRKLEEGRR